MAAAALITGVAWLQDLPSLTREEAVQVAIDALAAAGVDDAVVDPAPEVAALPDDPPADAREAWHTRAALVDGTIELWIGRDGEPVYLDDRSGDGSRHLLTDEQFETLASHRDNPARDRRLRRNLLVTFGALVAAGTAAALASAAPGVVVGRLKTAGARGHH